MDFETLNNVHTMEDIPVLLAELHPGRDQPYDWKSSCETWSVAFSPDGTWFAWSQGNGIVKLIPWPLEEEHLRPQTFGSKSQCFKVTEMKGRGSPKEKILDCVQIVWGLAFGSSSSPAGWRLWPCNRHCGTGSHGTWLLLATGLNDGHVKVWEVQTGKLIQVLSGHIHWVYCCAISPDCSMLCSAAGENSVLLWSMRSYTLIRKLEGHQNSVVSCDFSPDSALLVTASYDTTVIMWDPYTGEKLREFPHVSLSTDLDYNSTEPQLSSLRSVCFSPEGLFLASLADDRFLRIWSLDLQDPVSVAPVTNGLCCTFFPHGGILATGNRDGHVQFWTSPRVLSSLRHLCRKALRCFLTTYQVLALPIPGKMKDFLTYRT
ncbi:WD repeat and SOCS box-containing protein 2 isoform 3-T3 [Rhinophrynus dorsalis]